MSFQMPRLCKLTLFLTFLNYSYSFHHKNNDNILNKIVDTLDDISNKNNQLKTLIQSFVNIKPKHNVEEEDCVCVPFYLCNNGEITKDGRNLLESRLADSNPCHTIGDICCEQYDINVSSDGVTDHIPLDAECGYGVDIAGKYSHTSDRTVSKFGEYPWTAMVLNKEFGYQCVASLIHPEVVLTSAYCVNKSAEYIVRVGEWNTTGTNEPFKHQNGNVKVVVKHPKFNIDNLVYNAALLFMEKPFKLDANVKTACLAEPSPYTVRTYHSKCAATGWGRDSPTSLYRRVMKKIDYSLISHRLCEMKFRRTRLGKWFELHQSFICGMSDSGHDLCIGDGGGPLVCSISGQPLRFQQVGITSWGLDCAADFPSVFTKISHIRNWIDTEFNMRKLNRNYYSYKYT